MITQASTGHGTGNDFVLVLDPQGANDPTELQTALLADRRRGIGGDGVIRVVRSADSGIPGAEQAAAAGAEWFMDYRNADGSLAEMCGNGVRVFAHYLMERGLVDAHDFPVGTRDGTKRVERIADPRGGPEAWYRVDMGEYRFPRGSDGADSLVETDGIAVARPALSVDLGNPHTVLALASRAELDAADLRRPPRVDPVPPEGTNIEYIVVDPAAGHEPTGAQETGAQAAGAVRMRVHERGVGETFACGTGACAAALAARSWAGAGAPDYWFVEQPGGTVRVEVAGGRAYLSGPAVLTAEVTPSPELTAALEALAG
ncbi:diaminopimelate epimerase [Brevibacterium sp. BRM-1]|uniref:diaminopimelate epimerase n=1 Tax=Brevibacterium sp. BRM-1 TaxID=2999062 RepID=UPI00227FB355|nr:diaminopimelate epimerase [Brevibacterium sp. BRM-1]WAL41212.1 diaminopimelate epimerase [Brevibacterium sp. BRM-1]